MCVDGFCEAGTFTIVILQLTHAQWEHNATYFQLRRSILTVDGPNVLRASDT